MFGLTGRDIGAGKSIFHAENTQVGFIQPTRTISIAPKNILTGFWLLNNIMMILFLKLS